MIITGNSLEELKSLSPDSVDAVVTDPPYELGFMGKKWDSSGISYRKELWLEVFRVLKPGGHLLSFGGSRTYHRMACAIEDAGFEIRDQIMWVYGSGFPKSLNIGKQDDCEDWNGWGTALKPAHEPIVLARKPLSENTVAENVLKWGVGGLAIDNCRVAYMGDTDPRTFGGSWKKDKAAQNVYEGGYEGSYQTVYPQGRFPANFIHDGSQEVVELFPISNGSQTTKVGKTYGQDDGRSYLQTKPHGVNINDKGSASRFFYCAKASKSERDRGCEGLDMKQVGHGNLQNCEGFERFDTKGRNNHPTVKPLALMKYLIKLVSREGQTILDPFLGSGTTGIAAKELNREFIGIEMNPEYAEIAKRRIDA